MRRLPLRMHLKINLRKVLSILIFAVIEEPSFATPAKDKYIVIDMEMRIQHLGMPAWFFSMKQPEKNMR